MKGDDIQVIDVERPGKSTSVIVVRLNPLLHKALKSEAHRQEKSLNQLCVDTLSSLVNLERTGR